ncbi:MAG: hypothetical protein ACT4PK_02755 [Gammaproteobacteria bacterium]
MAAEATVLLRPAGWVGLGGLVAGALDISYACIYWAIAREVPAQRILQSVASGWLGNASYQGGWGSALLGLASHFFITLTMSAAYYALSRHQAALWQRPVLLGAAYGVLLFIVMNYVVVPLSNAVARGPGNDLWTWLSVVAHMVLVGIPIALATRQAHLAQ